MNVLVSALHGYGEPQMQLACNGYWSGSVIHFPGTDGLLPGISHVPSQGFCWIIPAVNNAPLN